MLADLQASPILTLVVTALHSALAGFLLGTYHGPRLPGYLSPAQAFGALLLFDVCIPTAVAWWRTQKTAVAGAQAASSDSATNAVAAQRAVTSSTVADKPGASSALRHRSTAKHAAEPASPGPALFSPQQQHDDSSPSRVTQPDAAQGSSTTAHPDAHLIQPSTPTGLQDSGSSPDRQHSASSTTAAAIHQAAHAAADIAVNTERADTLLVADQGVQQACTPQLSFEDALAACARGVAARQAAGSASGTMLYHSQLHHHVVSIKVGTVLCCSTSGCAGHVVHVLALATHRVCVVIAAHVTGHHCVRMMLDWRIVILVGCAPAFCCAAGAP